MTPVESIPGMGAGEIKENDGEDEFSNKNFGKCYNVPSIQQQQKS
jgi:hypothetical protein